MNDCVGIINLDENETKMGELVINRPLASVPIAGRYRIIDFVLSNMTNSGIESIGIFTKNKSRSLIDHLTNGRPWDLHRNQNGLRVFNFCEVDPVYEDVHNFSENIEFFKRSHKEYLLLTPSYMLCNIDYQEVIDYHKKSGQDITMVYKKTNNGKKSFVGCDVVNFDDLDEVVSIGENVGRDNNINISMEVYVLKTSLFIDIVQDCLVSGMYKKVKSFIHDNLDSLRVGAYKFDGELNCINSIKTLYDSNMNLLNRKISKEIFRDDRGIYTKAKDEAPTHYTDTSNVKNSIIANGCYIEGEVENCVIGRRVFVGKDAKLKNCVVMQDSIIEDKTVLDSVITDKGIKVKEGEKLIGSSLYPLVVMKKEYL